MPLQRSYSSKQSLQSLENPPALVHFWKCSWAAEPEPYSRGSIFHWHPVLRTYRIPLTIVRCGVGGQLPLGERTCLGKRGWTFASQVCVAMAFEAWSSVPWLDPPNRWQRSSISIITNQDLLVFEFMDAL